MSPCNIGWSDSTSLRRLALNVDTDDVVQKLRNDETLAWMKHLNL